MHTLSQREQKILTYIVESYWNTGTPVGSTTLAQRSDVSLSSATLRNIMSDLEQQGFLYSPHTSAGRLPTSRGLQYFVHNIMEVQEIPEEEKVTLTKKISATPHDTLEQKLNHISSTLSQISQCAGIISAPRLNDTLESLRFVKLSENRLLLVLVMQDGRVENRVLDLDFEVTHDTLAEAENYINAFARNLTLVQTWEKINAQITKDKDTLHVLTQKFIARGIEVIRPENSPHQFIVRGAANLLHDKAIEKDLAKMRELLTTLENHQNLTSLIDAAIEADGVQIFIGAENPLFANSDSALVLSPYTNAKGSVIGTIGVIGPSSYNYTKVIPMVNYTAKFLSQFFD